MKPLAISLCLILILRTEISGQSNQAADHMIEGGKVVVELLKVFAGKKDTDKNGGCKGSYADLCVLNESSGSISVTLQRAKTEEKKDMVILSGMKECSLQIEVGVWTYDLKLTGTTNSIRKGDILIEGCQSLLMSIK